MRKILCIVPFCLLHIFFAYTQSTGTNGSGLLKREAQYLPGGRLEWENRYEYDANKRVSKKVSFESDSNTTCTATYKYNDLGYLIEELWAREGREFSQTKTVFEYDAKGNVIKEINFSWTALENGSWMTILYWEYEYDDRNNIIKAIKHSCINGNGYLEPPGRIVYSHLYKNTYDAKNNLISVEWYDEKNKCVLTYTEYAYGEGCNVAVLTEYAVQKGERLLQKEIEYDDKGRSIKETEYINGEKRSIDVKEYDLDGRIIKDQRQDENGRVFCYFIYKYDSGEKIIKKTYHDDEGVRLYIVYEYY
ncbi:MAG: hypothetical protein JW822_13320 [Spirochaetales bacterium]|nr:hypothetical protein [Spirochaetales bacterium]